MTNTANTATFAARIASIASANPTAPFADRTSVYELYSRYRRAYADAGLLAPFKSRLVEAHKARKLSLARLDARSLLDAEEVVRSEIEVEGHHFHMVKA